ncbi:MAG TPA: hypothetical protein VM677_27825 [Actinokineospora sp.]|jgi:hypothetical protein|nr:hypothetical protein [Actinokineospora sp.]
MIATYVYLRSPSVTHSRDVVESRIRRWCAARDRVVTLFALDAGDDPDWNNRPAFGNILGVFALTKQPKADVVVLDWEQLSADPSVAAEMITAIGDAGSRIEFIAGGAPDVIELAS